MDAFPKEGKRGPPPNTKLPTVHTFPSTPPTSRRLACRICWTVRPEGMGAARLQDSRWTCSAGQWSGGCRLTTFAPRLPLLVGSPSPRTSEKGEGKLTVDPCWRAILHGQTTGRPARTRQWLQHPSSDMGPAPETRNSAWRLQVWSGQWQRIQPPNGAPTFSSCALTSRAANCAALALQDRAPSRRQRDYCAIRKASGDDSRGLPTQVPRRVSSQLKRDCADPRQRSKSIIAASQNLRPMTCRRGLWVFGATIENRSSPSASSASCGRLNQVVRPRRSWILVWLKWGTPRIAAAEQRLRTCLPGFAEKHAPVIDHMNEVATLQTTRRACAEPFPPKER
ncbi:hypothetical protein NA56DRAFT_658390 [Hyaloscypha hepaticicola]|uniref:Uncharacterized protein n=1 Tax=Hyaloscypha hepaticicola TaxID=2082293 RepID=A0A2J6Q6J9_9HELO|nr:hypothetical protein NA56DRAFT_658390 [Hyaloscypha hepaticicola]